ncbi:hypothetical protein Tco_0791715 [Tanacetum coccineum]
MSVWKVLPNGNSKSESPKGKDGVLTGKESLGHAVNASSKRSSLGGFSWHGDAQRDYGQPFKTRFVGNANRRKCKKAIWKQLIEAFSIDALGAGLCDEDANHKFLRRRPREEWMENACAYLIMRKSFEYFIAHYGHFARECKFKGSKEGSRQEAGRGQDFKPVRTEKEALMTIDEGQINWVEQTTDEELNHALMAFTVNNEYYCVLIGYNDIPYTAASNRIITEAYGVEKKSVCGVSDFNMPDEHQRGLPSKSFKNDHTCIACQKGKQHNASCKAKIDRYTLTYHFIGETKQSILLAIPSTGKAFRVYNLVTKRVEVNLHVNFLEEKPNVQGIGHRFKGGLCMMYQMRKLQTDGGKSQKALEDGQVVEAMQEELLQVFQGFNKGVAVINKGMLCFSVWPIDDEVYVHNSGFVDPGFHPTKVIGAPIDKTYSLEETRKVIMLVQVYVDDYHFWDLPQVWCDEFEALMQEIQRVPMQSLPSLQETSCSLTKDEGAPCCRCSIVQIYDRFPHGITLDLEAFSVSDMVGSTGQENHNRWLSISWSKTTSAMQKTDYCSHFKLK